MLVGHEIAFGHGPLADLGSARTQGRVRVARRIDWRGQHDPSGHASA